MKSLTYTFTATIMALLQFACSGNGEQKAKTTAADTLTIPECVVTTPPDSLGLDTFYKKYVNVNGLPLISS